jgi:hypothetical protein
MVTADDLQFLDTGLAQFIGVAGRFFQYGALFENGASQALWIKWMGLLEKYRRLLAADIVHVRRPTGRTWDAMMHADPTAPPGEPKGLAIFFNPTNATMAVNTALSVYYCGFVPGAAVNMLFSNGTSNKVTQDAFFNLPVATVLPPRGYDFIVLS